ncbi:MFS transporter [Paraglaciecola sp.]|uniref:MFS transporter n=1 Tax=Paraglaciecola sp. TaxID=1920173 RepID=UPI0030F498DD
MPRLLTIAAIAACYFLFAILLNSVGTVILQSINSFGVSKPDASVLEGFKDLSIAGVSFLVASFIPRAGYKLAMLTGLVLVGVLCAIVPSVGSFWMIKLLFAGIGTAFALVKVSVYAIIGQLSTTTRAHSSLMNTIEGIFMLGVLSGYWIFSAFIDPNDVNSPQWLSVYYLLALLSVATLIMVMLAPIERESLPVQNGKLLAEFFSMLKLVYQPLVLIFVLSVFMYVLIEQGIGSWLPTFNKEVLGLPVQISIQITSVFAVSLAIGRLLAGVVLRRVNWYPFLNVCLLLMAALIIISLPLAQKVPAGSVTSIWHVPPAALLFPLIGLLMAPLYPVLNSVMLSALPRRQHAPMTGLIVVFSALGGTTGSIITGYIFDAIGGQKAFFLSLIPIGLILITLFFFRRSSQAVSASSTTTLTNEI